MTDDWKNIMQKKEKTMMHFVAQFGAQFVTQLVAKGKEYNTEMKMGNGKNLFW